MENNKNISIIIGLSIISGTLILVSALMPLIWTQYLGFGFMGMMGMMGFGSAWFFNISLINISSGLIIIFSAIMIGHTKNTRMFGILILVFAALSLIGFGGFFIGAILGIISGALALSS